MSIKKKLNILFLCDEKVTIRSVSSVFESAGCIVDALSSIEMVLANLREESFDIILVDLEKPPKMGFEVITMAREGLGINIPIIVLAEQNNQDGVIEAIKLGATDVLLKPIKANELLEMVYKQARKRNKSLENLEKAILDFKKNYLFNQKDFLENSISEFLANDICKNIRMNPIKRNEVFLILEEAITNAYMHGLWILTREKRQLDKKNLLDYITTKTNYDLDDIINHYVKVGIYYHKENSILKITVKDTGNGFNYQKYLENSYNVNDYHNTQGLGLEIMKILSDNISYYDNGSKLEVDIKVSMNA